MNKQTKSKTPRPRPPHMATTGPNSATSRDTSPSKPKTATSE